MTPHVPQGDDDRADETAVKDAARSNQGQELGRPLPEVLEVHDQQHQLGAHQRAHDDGDAEIEGPRGVESLLPRANERELQSHEVRGCEQHPVGVNRNGAELKKSGEHGE